ncbi:MAG: polymer-forming cytoskeletal protein [Elusimicrobiota bacterium]
MAFGNNKSQEKQKKPLPKIETIIGHDTKIKGDIIMPLGSLRVDGFVEGANIECEGIILGEKGNIKGNIKAQIVVIAGVIEGDIYASERLEILLNAKVIGDVTTGNLSIAEGSTFEGNCKMLKPEPLRETQTIAEQEHSNTRNAHNSHTEKQAVI